MSPQNPFLALDRQIIGDIHTSNEVMDNLTFLCDECGSRFPGSAGEGMAVEFMQEKMRAYGLCNVHTEAFPYGGWQRGEAMLEILQPVQKTLPCISLPYAPAGTVEALLVDMDAGHPDDFTARGGEIAGQIVLTTSENPAGMSRGVHRLEKYGRSLLAGAVGFLFVNHSPGSGPVTGGIGHGAGPGAIPGLGLAYEDGCYLQRLLARHGQVKLRLTTTDINKPAATSWNVVGELPGTTYPDEIVMVGCHYDGHDISQGAGDPASGAVAVLEAARVLAQYAAPARTIRFVLWGVEEIGIIGSAAYVQTHADELERIRFYLNLDAAGTSADIQDIVLNEWPELTPLFEGWKAEMADTFAIGQSVHSFSDHFPFFLQGVPTSCMERANRRPSQGRGYGHTQFDTLDKIEIGPLRVASERAARWLLRIANEEKWPISRRTKEAAQSLLETPAYRETAELRAQVDAFYSARGQP
ncbi:MAG: aminopeptidase [Chloroflexi bacterium]|nr:MAG: aminopeptidase [Chloroflexota bacterium]